MNAVKIFGTRNATRVSLLPRRFKGATAIAADLALAERREREREREREKGSLSERN